MMAIFFPHLNPIAFTFFGFDVYWYSFAYIVGVLLGYVFIKRLNQHYKPVFSPQALDDLIVYSVLGIVLGGRIGYVIFYDFAKTINDPLNLFMIRGGGMSFHGGALGLILSIYWLCRKYKINVYSALDLIVCVVPIGLFLGRIANFVNQELYGKITDVAWGVIFATGGNLPRHPSQLYEALSEGILLFCFLMYLFYHTKYIKKPGALGGFFLLGYGVSRIVIEGFREPDPQLGYFFSIFTMGQILSLPMLILGIYFITRKPKIRRRNKNIL